MFIASTMPVGACIEVAPSQDHSVPPLSWRSGATTMLISTVRYHRKLTIICTGWVNMLSNFEIAA